jgi:hypothetical protein
MKKSIILAVTAAALVMGMAGCKNLNSGSDGVDGTKTDKNWGTETAPITNSSTSNFKRFYYEFGTNKTVTAATCTLYSKYAKEGTVGFIFGLQQNADTSANVDFYNLAFRNDNGTAEYYLSHFVNVTSDELNGDGTTFGTETSINSTSGNYSTATGLTPASDGSITVYVSLTQGDTDGTYVVKFGPAADNMTKTTTITDSTYNTSYKSGVAKGGIACYGMIKPATSSTSANSAYMTYKVTSSTTNNHLALTAASTEE